MWPRITLVTPLPRNARTLARGETIAWFAEKLLSTIDAYEWLGHLRARDGDAALLTALLARDLRRRAPDGPGEADDPMRAALIGWLRETADGIEAGNFDALARAPGPPILTADDGLAASEAPTALGVDPTAGGGERP